uniref:hypothetical protein n=1 Tax=Xanthomonas graminis TaxID=3390026 RepID=UPI00396486BD
MHRPLAITQRRDALARQHAVADARLQPAGETTPISSPKVRKAELLLMVAPNSLKP